MKSSELIIGVEYACRSSKWDAVHRAKIIRKGVHSTNIYTGQPSKRKDGVKALLVNNDGTVSNIERVFPTRHIDDPWVVYQEKVERQRLEAERLRQERIARKAEAERVNRENIAKVKQAIGGDVDLGPRTLIARLEASPWLTSTGGSVSVTLTIDELLKVVNQAKANNEV